MDDEVTFDIAELWRAIAHAADNGMAVAKTLETWEKKNFRSNQFPDLATAKRLMRHFAETRNWTPRETASQDLPSLVALLDNSDAGTSGSEAQNRATTTRSIKPNKDTLSIIRALQAKKDPNTIALEFATSACNVRTIKSRLKKGEYTI